MNKEQLQEFKEARRESPQINRFDVSKLVCYGCAHSNAMADFPSGPSGERPCCSCIRNPEREDWAKDKGDMTSEVKIDNQDHARQFDAFGGNAYNGAPYVYFPIDNYVTLDQRDQEEFFDDHPEYAKPIHFDNEGNVTVVEE